MWDLLETDRYKKTRLYQQCGARHRTTTWCDARAVTPVNERSTAMGGKMDQVKGRIKEAAGALTDDESLTREG